MPCHCACVHKKPEREHLLPPEGTDDPVEAQSGEDTDHVTGVHGHCPTPGVSADLESISFPNRPDLIQESSFHAPGHTCSSMAQNTPTTNGANNTVEFSIGPCKYITSLLHALIKCNYVFVTYNTSLRHAFVK